MPCAEQQKNSNEDWRNSTFVGRKTASAAYTDIHDGNRSVEDLKDAVIKYINKVLESSWSEKEVKMGKNIYCLSDWKTVLPSVTLLYEEHGWLIEKSVVITSTNRQFFLNIKNPNWSKK